MNEQDAPLMLALQTIGDLQKEIASLHRSLYHCFRLHRSRYNPSQERKVEGQDGDSRKPASGPGVWAFVY